MKALVIKELRSLFCSSIGAFFSLSFLLCLGGLLWLFSGSFNILESGYANLNQFFSLASILLLILIPALTMRQFAEEKRNKTLEVLRSRPISIATIYASKYIASYLFIFVTLLPTIIYVYSVYQLANPIGHIDLSAIVTSYFSLFLLIGVFVAIGLFASSVSNNQAVSFIITIILAFFSYYGFELISSFFLTGKIQLLISSLGLYNHYNLMQRGVIQLKDLLVIFNYIFIFTLLSIFVLDRNKQKTIYAFVFIVVLNIVFLFIPNIQFDFTQDKRYTLSEYSYKLLDEIKNHKKEIHIEVYLDGELNASFQQLQNAVQDITGQLVKESGNTIAVSTINPYDMYESADETNKGMFEKGMPGITLNEKDRQGKLSQKIIYPYALVSIDDKGMLIPLLKNISGNTADQNINASIENLEYEFIRSLHAMTSFFDHKQKKVLFTEGHGELSKVYTYDAMNLLSSTGMYVVERDTLSTYQDKYGLDDVDIIVVAGPIQKIGETEKYWIDQFIMSGGRVLWLVDGAYYSYDNLSNEGHSASIRNDVNLDDMLFTYGVRINPDLLQDKQSASIYLMTGDDVQTSTLLPFYYMPLLMPMPDHAITKDIRDVKAGFVSSIDLVNNSSEVDKKILLTTSAYTHIVKVPDVINFDTEGIQDTPNYFDKQFIPVAVSMEGTFNSVFTNRILPDSVNHKSFISKSKPTKMIITSSSDMIRNNLDGEGQDVDILPMGYDRVSNIQYGNPDFILNAIDWLVDDEGLMSLRTKQQQLYPFNKQLVYEQADIYKVLNVAGPLLFIILVMGSVFVYRKRKYEKRSKL